ncbi:hypothetical protein OKA05_23555 [Luteolibacter arcticus]|uniref:SMI1/KNR4 family protein n=1 Tax=Luteolibacter arcticus TaxID=1581411 RepID=A0ABT3GPU8_9BACT|nr:hypothetical protein [Luteolibacter arcticus]MCW1925555.1 hypothetical protein [Luteolibacter arcticus]
MSDQAYSNTSDFPLPAEKLPDDVKAQLDPWVAGFVGLSREQAGQRLRDRWNRIERPSLLALRDTLLKFEVQGISKTHSGYAIEAYRPGSEDPGIGDYWYLSGPMDHAEISKRLAPFGLEGNEALRDFLYYFGGLGEDTETAGHFVSAARDWAVFENTPDSFIDLRTTKGFDEWKGALMLFHARNGCHILVRRDGTVGWWVMQEATVTTEAVDFDGFIRMFNKHRQISWPFDPYPPDEGED